MLRLCASLATWLLLGCSAPLELPVGHPANPQSLEAPAPDRATALGSGEAPAGPETGAGAAADPHAGHRHGTSRTDGGAR